MIKPFKKASWSNINQTYHEGHKAIDWGGKYGTPLVAPERVLIQGINGDLYTVDPNDKSRLTFGYGIKMKGLESEYEYLYWHNLPFHPVNVGDTVEAGQIVAYMGNSGNVWSNGIPVPVDERTEQPHRGTHLHHEVYLDGEQVNFVKLIDFSVEPSYTIIDELSAMARALSKIAKAVK